MSDRRVAIAAVTAWILIAGIGWAMGTPLGHDEAAYAIEGQRLLAGQPPYWGWYRPEGMSVIAAIGVAAGGSEHALRLVTLVLGAGVVVATWAVGRAAFGPRVGALAAAVIVGAHPMVLRGAELLNDLPALACVLAGIAIVIHELERDGGPSWRLVAAAPALAAAFYLRYGSAPVIAIAGVAAAAVWWRAIIRRPWPCVAAAAAFAVLLVPHLVRSQAYFHHPLALVRAAAATPRRAYVGEGLVTYLTANPFAYYGLVVAPVVIAGLIAIVRPPAARRRPARFFAAVGVGQLVAVGLASHGQPRYVFPAVVVLVILGVEWATRLEAARPRAALRRGAAAVIAASWIAAAAMAPVLARRIGRAYDPVVAAAEAIRVDAAGRPCVIAAVKTPPLQWYAGCDGHGALFGGPLPRDPSRAAYIVSTPAEPVELAVFAGGRQTTPVPVARAGVTVVRVDP